MKYDFISIMDRWGRDAIAVDGVNFIPDFAPARNKDKKDIIPMWIADMNFPTCPTIPAAIIERAKHPAYGYFPTSEEFYEAIIRWHEKRKGVPGLTKGNISYQNGVIGGVISALNVFCTRGDNVLVHSPTYNGFTNSLTDNGYHIIHSPLIMDNQNVWRMDFEDMEKKIVENHIHAAVFCSPHNPCGRVWERWELEMAMEIFKKHDVYVVSDEIWSDIVFDGHKHIPLQSVNEDARMRTVALYAPSKTFNMAGLLGSYHVIYNQRLFDQVKKEAGRFHHNKMNVLSMHALIGAYTQEGSEWCDELCEVLAGNINFACQYIQDHFEGIRVAKPEGTYMLFLDCTEWCARHNKTIEQVLNEGYAVGVLWQEGKMFHAPCHIRMNLALPLSRVQEAFDRLDKYVFNA